MKLFHNISELVTMSGARAKQGRGIQESDLGIIKNACLVEDKGKIIWLGEEKKLPAKQFSKAKEIDLKKTKVLPGFVECHTHSLFAGSRSQEFELRNQGISYQQINAQGGGIKSTMRATRKMNSLELTKLLQARIKNFVEQGVTTLEIKTGYALDQKNELRCLKILNQKFAIPVIPTYLGPHSIPDEFPNAKEYLNFCAEKMLPKIRKLTKRVDIFIESGFFEFDDSKKYLEIAKKLGFQITIHADQLSYSQASELALQFGAISADHLIQTPEYLIKKLAKSETTCVLLPAADLYMKCAYPKARKMIDEGCRVALATDFNPGSSPTQDLTLVGLLARLEMKMTLPEVLSAYTVSSSYALGLQDQCGHLSLSTDANFFCSDKAWDQHFYSVGTNSVSSVFVLGNELT